MIDKLLLTELSILHNALSMLALSSSLSLYLLFVGVTLLTKCSMDLCNQLYWAGLPGGCHACENFLMLDISY